FPLVCSIIGAGGLNGRVRNGNGCGPSAMVTGNSLSLNAHMARCGSSIQLSVLQYCKNKRDAVRASILLNDAIHTIQTNRRRIPKLQVQGFKFNVQSQLHQPTLNVEPGTLNQNKMKNGCLVL